MSKKTKTTKATAANTQARPFIDELQRQLRNARATNEMIRDRFDDGSGSYVELKLGIYTISFTFNDEGTLLTDIHLFKDIIGVVETQLLA